MVRGWRAMELLLGWLCAALWLSLPSLSRGSPLYVLSAPNLLRVGGPERVFVEAQDYTGDAFDVTLTVKDYPRKTTELVRNTLHLSPDNNYQKLAEITIPFGNDVLVEDDTLNQYVYLQAQFPGHLLEKVVLVSFQSGYVFVQTDKTIYTPSSTVLYRIYTLSPSLKPSEKQITVDVMNPEGTVVNQEAFTPQKGICSGVYKIPDFASTGTWTIVTGFKGTTKNNFSYEFEVKHYVLPRIEVMLTPQKSYFYIDDEELRVNISARYLDGSEVTGVGLVVFAVQGAESDKRKVDSTQRVEIDEGRGHAVLSRQHLQQMTSSSTDLLQLTGASIHVKVTVLTHTGHEMAEANLDGIRVVSSPYVIRFERTPKYFKPGMPFTCLISVDNPDGSPAGGVQVEITDRKSEAISGITERNGLVKLTVNTDTKDSVLLLSASTKAPGLTDAQQARADMTALPYVSKGRSKNYLHIGLDAAELTIGDQLKINLNLRGSPGAQNNDFTYLILSKGLLVSVGRLRRQGQEMISLSLPVTKEMVPSFRIVAYYHVGSSEVVSDSVWVDVKDTCMGTVKVEASQQTYSPRQHFSLTITGDPGARVGLVAVDKGVYVLNNKHRLTQSKIWDTVDKLDIACTAGSGKDSMGVFYDAGLMFQTNTAGGTDPRTSTHCPSHVRRQRSLKGKDQILFTSVSSSQLGFVADAITSWAITAISLSEATGMCVAPALDIGSTKHFSLDLKVPHHSKCNEQLEIVAILHNLEDSDIQVQLKLVETRRMCSLATDRGGYRTTVELRAGGTRAVPFVIVPMEIGEQTVEVMAVSADARYTDGVRRNINVLPAGVLRKKVVNMDLNPLNSGGFFTSVIGPELTTAGDKIPNMPVHHLITAQAHHLTPRMEGVLSGETLAPLLRRTGFGGGEQDLVTLATPLIAIYYLDRTQQWLEGRTEAVRAIGAGYQKLLSYRKLDGSYSAYKTTHSSTWLTAFVAKAFSMASGIASIDGNMICSALLWLSTHVQNPDGSFREPSPVPYTVSSTGNVYGRDRDASLTAFVLIAMQETPAALCTEKIISNSKARAAHYLGLRIHTLTNPYAVAMVSYALANAGVLRQDILLRQASAGGFNWPVPGNHLFTLEATAYALLALVKAKEFEKAAPIVKWLKSQQKSGGGYGSTQATLMVYQALAEYTAQGRQQQTDTSLEVTLNMADRTRPLTWTFTRARALRRHSVKLRLDENVTVTARGNGRGSLSVITMYYSMPSEQEGPCHKFQLNLTFQELPQGSREEASANYLLTIDILYQSNDRESTTAILNIGILTGYVIHAEDLKKLATGRTWKMDEKSSSQGNMVIYLNEVNDQRPERITFRLRRVVNVDLLQPAGVSVRDYNSHGQCDYNSHEECLKFYHPEKANGTLGLICQQHVCKCAAESCGVQMKQVAEDVSRHEVACRLFRDYVYKVTVEAVNLSSWIDTYHLRVKLVVKPGTDDIVEEDIRQFLSLPQCRQGLDLTEGKTYLIIGRLPDLMKVNERYQYVLSKHTWIEYWPTESEGETSEFKSKYMAIEQFSNELRHIGCQL
ncbi:complement C3-like [Sardina pilchardus]|uniref:complement C3-like n=1 Tax=Sardina pilchardus TaxID=27697 RepID=UPI002E0F739F